MVLRNNIVTSVHCLSATFVDSNRHHGSVCLELDKERVYFDSVVSDPVGPNCEAPGVLPLVSVAVLF